MKVDKHIPIPSGVWKGRPRKYPFNKMEVGDSFFTKNPRANVAAAARMHGRRHGVKFASKVTKKGCRIWRIE